jgi:hypothetical protein
LYSLENERNVKRVGTCKSDGEIKTANIILVKRAHHKIVTMKTNEVTGGNNGMNLKELF